MAMDLQVYLEMVDFGLASAAAGDVTFERTQMTMDDTLYDGATYYFEVHAINDDSGAIDVTLVDSGGTAKATVSVAAGTSTIERQTRVSFTPVSGSEIYRIKVGQTTGDEDVKVSCARIIVDQVNATKTCVQIPLISCNTSIWQSDSLYSLTDTDGYIYASNPTSWGNHLTTHAMQWMKDESRFSTISQWRFEAVIAGTTGVNFARIRLYNKTDAADVSGTLQTVAQVPTLLTTDIANGAANFDNLDYFEPQWSVSLAFTQVRIYSIRLYVEITSLTACETWHRVQFERELRIDTTFGLRRVLYERNKWNSVNAVYLIVCGYTEGTAQGTIYIRNHGSNDSGTNGSNLGGILFDTGGSTVEYKRSSAIGVPDGVRIITRQDWESGGALNDFRVIAAFVVVAILPKSTGTILFPYYHLSPGR